MSRTMDTVKTAWGTAPDWVLALAEAVGELGSQAAAGKRIGYSAATVNLILNNRYRGNLERVADAVRAGLLKGTVACPMLGDIPYADCRANQQCELVASSAARVRLWKACRNCKHRRQ